MGKNKTPKNKGGVVTRGGAKGGGAKDEGTGNGGKGKGTPPPTETGNQPEVVASTSGAGPPPPEETKNGAVAESTPTKTPQSLEESDQKKERESNGDGEQQEQNLISDTTPQKKGNKPSIGKRLLTIRQQQEALDQEKIEMEQKMIQLEQREMALQQKIMQANQKKLNLQLKQFEKTGHLSEDSDEVSGSGSDDDTESDDDGKERKTINSTEMKEEKFGDTGTPLFVYTRKSDTPEDSRKYVTTAEEVKSNERKSEPSPQQQSTSNMSEIEKLAQVLSQLVTNQNRTSEKFMARQSREKQLPDFDGDPMMWPIFSSRYKKSTEECGFSNQENMGRLERSLKGKAKETVAALMIVPDNAPEVFETLRRRFGRPDYVVAALTEKIEEITPPTESNLKTLQVFGDKLKSLVETIKAMECPHYLTNPTLLNRLTQKLPESLQLRWGEHLLRKEGEIPTLQDFSRWTDRMAEAISLVKIPTSTSAADKDKNWRNRKDGRRRGKDFGAVNAHEEEPRKEFNGCELCGKKGHSPYKCNTFLELKVEDRWKLVKKKKLCFNCLRGNHRHEDCISTWTCGVKQCARKHNRLLHQDPLKKKRETRRLASESEDEDEEPHGENKKQNPKPQTKKTPASVNAVAEEDGEEEENHHYNELSSRKILLRVINVTLHHGNKKVNTCALVDEASTVTMMDEELANQLELKGRTAPLTLKWSNGLLQKESSSRKVNLQISGGKGKKFNLNNVRTIANLNLATQSYNGEELKRKWPHLRDHNIPSFTGKPKLLIGQENQHLTLSRKIIENGEEGPVITLTKLGWVLHGPTTKNSRNSDEEQCCHCTYEEDDATMDGKTDLDSEGRWYTGPEFLKLPDEGWPKRTMETLALPELRKNEEEEVCAVVHEESVLPKPEKFSSWIRMLRVGAAVMEAIPKLQKRIARTSQKEQTTTRTPQNKKKEIRISAPSMKKAETILLRDCQWESFPEEMNFLKKKKEILGRSRLHKLCPFLDEEGVMRMNSRTGSHPIILDPHHHTTKLIINHYHRMAWHQGLDQIRNEIRQKFWILHLRDAVKRAGFDCMECVRRKAKPKPAMMVPLPSIRTTKPEGAFAAVGMDYFGPMEVTVGRRKEKRWGVIFTCMAVRAIHLEIAASLSTDSCIMAIRRFIAKRGHPRIIISDNGTNLRGADTEMKKCLEELEPDKIENELLNKGIEWRFNPPGAPHFGGAFERLIGSVKTAMKIVLKTQAPKEELLQTIMAEAEGIINSRPLTEIPVEPKELEALTPMHFLIGRSSPMQPCGEFSEDDLLRRKQWKHAQVLAEQFWRRWLREYLPTLQRRSKWHHGDPGLKKGDIVVVVDETLKKGHFPLGRIAETFPGKDGIVRVVEVITATGKYRRPVTKVAKPDICHEKKEDSVEGNPKTEVGPEAENIRNTS